MPLIERSPVIFLRNRLLLVIVSLLLLGGYCHQLLASCDDAALQKMEQSGEKKGQQPVKHTNDGCQCLCHKNISNTSLTSAILPDPILVSQPAYFAIGDAPPDRQPQGIDHPPQLS